MSKVFRSLKDMDEAKRALFEALKPSPLGVEEVDITESINRVLAEDIVADIDVPSFDRSTRDGYALRYRDTVGAREDEPVKLRIIGELEAGEYKDIYVNEGEAVAIATGAPVPAGADSIIMEEYTVREGDIVYIYKQANPGEWIESTGSDISMGEVVFHKGTVIGVREVGVLAALGRRRVKVYRRPRVGIISTGDEISQLGAPLKPGMIYDVNAYTIYSRLIEDGCKPIYMGISRDDPEVLRRMIGEALDRCDIVLSSGSTSVGIRDNLYRVLRSFRDTVFLFHGIRVSPGKPTIACIVDGKLFIGLPGFPVSCLMIYDNVFSDLLRRYAGLPPRRIHKLRASSGQIIRGRGGLRTLYPIILKDIGGRIYFYPLTMTSGAIASLQQADGYVVIGEDEEYIDVGEDRIIHLFSGEIQASNLFIITSHSIVLEELLRVYRSKREGVNIKLIPVGSYGGLRAIEDGYNDIAGIHILDRDTLEYNVPILVERGVRDVTLYRGFEREIGIVVRKGNPKHITGLRDVLRDDIVIVNRVQGSGTRIFFDHKLRELAEEEGISIDDLKRSIKGYNVEAKTHSSVVAAVEHGRADMGIAVRPVTVGRDVDFIPLAWESFDILVSSKSLRDNEVVRGLIDFLSTSEARNIIRGFRGVRIPGNYMEVIYSS